MMAKKEQHRYSISVQTYNKELHRRFRSVCARIGEHGFKKQRVIPEFIVEMLEREEASGFEGLKKYI